MMERLIIYFLFKSGRCMSDIRLLALIYLVDMYRVKWKMNQVTNAEWKRFLGVPHSEQFYDVLHQLEREGRIEKSEDEYFKVSEAVFVPIFFPLELRLMIDNVFEAWNDQPILSLLDYVSSTAPMRAVEGTPYDKHIDVDLMLERAQLNEWLDLRDGENKNDE